jgi:hypothetical protein
MTIRQAIFSLLILLVVLAMLLQCAIDPSSENVAAAAITMAASLTVLLYLAWSQALDTSPLQAFAVFGFCMTTLAGALLVQTAAWTPLRSSLYDPLGTFGALAFYQGVSLAMLVAYRFFSVKTLAGNPGNGVFRRVLGSFNIYEFPPVKMLWIMGVIGFIFGLFLSRYDGIPARIAAGCSFLAWAPFLIPLYLRERGNSYCNAKTNYLLLAVYTGCVALLGLAINSRAVTFDGLVTMFLLYLLAGMRSNASLTRSMVFRVCAIAIVGLLLAQPLSNLTTSMAIARQFRGRVSTSEMVRTTLDVYSQPKLIAAYKKERDAGASQYAAYDEHYIANPMLARFVNTKFVDNALHFANGIKTEDAKSRLREMTVKFLWAALPAPVLAVLHVHVNKDELGFSIGDYLAYLSRGVPLGGHKVGSIFAQGWATLGPLFPFVYALICLVFYALLDLLTIRQAGATATVATLGALGIWQYFEFGLNYEAFHYLTTFVMRDFAQMFIIYAVVFGVARVFTGGKKPVAARRVA